MLPKTLAAIAGSAAFAILPAMAGSAPSSDVEKIEISTKGYDLSQPADAKIILSKINRAADQVCGRTNIRQALSQRVIAQQCHEEAVTRAVESIDSPVLTSAMQSRFDYS
ncbi:MAG: UrcA family protein [Pseudomonadota bacterium]